jgi:hypothetical protein
MTSSTRTSGAEAPAVMPRLVIEPNSVQSISLARWTRAARGQPARSATSLRRCVLEEFGEPTTIMASTMGATFLTTSWRLVVA